MKQQQVLRGHENWVFCVVALRNGMLASGSADKTIRIWDVEKGICTTVIEGHEEAISGLAELRSGLLVSGSYDGTIRLYDIANSKCTRVLEGHDAAVYCVKPLSDGRLASGSDDGTVRIWGKGYLNAGRTREGDKEDVMVLKGHEAAVTSIAELEGGMLATSSDDRTVRLWDLKSGKMKKKLTEREEPVLHVAPISGGRIALCGANATVCMMGAQGAGLLEGHTAPVSNLVQLSREMAVSCSFDQTLRLWDLTDGTCLDVMEGHEGWVYAVAELPEGKLASCSTDMTIRIWA